MAGRPPDYDAVKIAEGVAKYIKDCKKNHYLPTIEGLAVHLSVHRSTLYEWADAKSPHYHDEFSDIFEQLKAAQASALIQNGLKGEYNATITKLMLSKHDYVERQSHEGKDGGPIQVENVEVTFVKAPNNGE